MDADIGRAELCSAAGAVGDGDLGALRVVAIRQLPLVTTGAAGDRCKPRRDDVRPGIRMARVEIVIEDRSRSRVENVADPTPKGIRIDDVVP